MIDGATLGDDSQKLRVTPIHPFPARMAPSIAWENLVALDRKPLRILDPMLGSGTTAVIARSLGHSAVGFDSDPLSVLIASTWCSDINREELISEAAAVLEKAVCSEKTLNTRQAYPTNCNQETRRFVRYWFDRTSRRQLTSLSSTISSLGDCRLKPALWCAFYRMIITKKIGVSLAMDISHSRPHKVYKTAPIRPFDAFLSSVNSMARRMPFDTDNSVGPKATIMRGDARHIPLSNASVDIVITSPPYLNAIDYMRGHRLTLVWMGYSSQYLRALRSRNIGAERGLQAESQDHARRKALSNMGEIDSLPSYVKAMLLRYVSDMNAALSEISRVLVPKGQAVLVVGDSTINGIFISNSNAIVSLAEKHHLQLHSINKRKLPDHRRYLPPPSLKKAGDSLKNRMREEVIVSLVHE